MQPSASFGALVVSELGIECLADFETGLVFLPRINANRVKLFL